MTTTAIDKEVGAIVQDALDGATLDAQALTTLFNLRVPSRSAALLHHAARTLSEEAAGGKTEVHAQVGLNVGACAKNCTFCSFAAVNHLFDTPSELPLDEVVRQAVSAEADGANAVFLMGTARFAFEKLIRAGEAVRAALKPETPLVANTGDFDLEHAKTLKSAGFAGIYHAVRLGEGRDTAITPQERMRTMRAATEAGLLIGTCLEPAGPEHSVEELVEKTLITREVEPVYSGCARRIAIPGTEMARRGMISELRLAHLVAVVRLAMGRTVPGNCTHEPNVLGPAAGASLFWAETGANPRDTEAATEKSRGLDVTACRRIFEEAEWTVLDGPSRFYGSAT